MMKPFKLRNRNVEEFDAWQWDGLDISNIPSWVDNVRLALPMGRELIRGNGYNMVNLMDYVLRTSSGQTKIFRQDEFERTFSHENS